MKRNFSFAIALVALASVVLQGCGPQTRESMKRDVNYTADKAEDRIHDARD